MFKHVHAARKTPVLLCTNRFGLGLDETPSKAQKTLALSPVGTPEAGWSRHRSRWPCHCTGTSTPGILDSAGAELFVVLGLQLRSL